MFVNPSGQRKAWGFCLALLALACGAAPAKPAASTQPAAKLKTYQTRYYTIHTDLDPEAVREAAARMTAMAEEYHRRTEGFAGTIRQRLPFHLFSNAKDYYAAGGRRGTAGAYNGKELMAVASRKDPDRVWQVVQHEAFHQFAHKVIRGRLPIWVNEGLAEYFGQGIWTGDNFVTGLVPPERLKRLKAHIDAGRILPFLKMLPMSHKEWNSVLSGRNYDQAWSMIHFLVHADRGRYRPALEAFVTDISRGQPYKQSFLNRFGRDVEAFENRYRQWWAWLPPDPTADRYVLATVQTLCSFLARANAQGQTFADAEAFFQAVEAGALKTHPSQWLPPRLLERALESASKLGGWSLAGTAQRPALVLAQPGGLTFTGTFTIRDGLVEDVRVQIKQTPPSSAPAASAPSQPTE